MDTAWIILDPRRKGAPVLSPSRSILAGVSREARTPLRGWTVAVLALYALIVLCAPALHHDFACHDKTPGHCVACVASPSAPKVTAKLVIEPAITALERVVDADSRPAPAQRLAPLPGRAPPA